MGYGMGAYHEYTKDQIHDSGPGRFSGCCRIVVAAGCKVMISPSLATLLCRKSARSLGHDDPDGYSMFEHVLSVRCASRLRPSA